MSDVWTWKGKAMNPEDIALAIILGAFFVGIGVGSILTWTFLKIRGAF